MAPNFYGELSVMKNQSTGFLFAAALLAAGCAWGQMGSSGMSGTYTQFEAATLKKSPHHAWARSIAFLDEITAIPSPSDKPQRLDRRMYYPLELKTAGTAWIREDRYDQFQALPLDTPFTFGGTVDQFSRRYYLILDAAFQVEVLPTQEERWLDVLANPPRPPAPDILPDETAADLPPPVPAVDEPEAEPLADTPSWSKVMTDIVGITDNTPPEPPVPEDVPAETGEAAASDVPDLPSGDTPAEPELEAEAAPSVDDMFAGIEDLFPAEPTDASPSVAEAEDAGDDTGDPQAPEEAYAVPIEVEDASVAFVDVQELETDSLPARPEEPVEDALAAEIEPLVLEEEPASNPESGMTASAEPSDSAEDAGTPGEPAQPESVPVAELAFEDTDSGSYHVEPMGDTAPIAIVPLVSLQPTKAELEVQEARRREAEREEAIRRKEAERQARIEAKRQREEEAKRQKAEAVARKKAEAEARAELERTRREAEAARKAEEKRLREEEAVALAAMEAREEQERETAARIAAREATQQERDDLAARIEAEKAAIAERFRMVQEVTAAEQAAREEAERLAREENERQEALLAEKARMEAELAALAEQEREMNDRLAAEQAAREEAERLAREETERQEALLAEKAEVEAELAAQAERERVAAELLAAEQAAREEAERNAKLSRSERRAAAKAAAAAKAKAEAEAKAAAEAEKAEPAAPQPAGDIPEWMQPAIF